MTITKIAVDNSAPSSAPSSASSSAPSFQSLERNWEKLIRPHKIDIDPGIDKRCFATITAKPLERGFGLTLGNAIRRVLLSSLQGAAVTCVQIEGVLHEFSTVPGVREDVTDIILKLKELALRCDSAQPRKIHLKADKPGNVTAEMIDGGGHVEIINPALQICTLDKDSSLNIEMTVEQGKGYASAEQNRHEALPIGAIPDRFDFQPCEAGLLPRREHARRTGYRLRQAQSFGRDERNDLARKRGGAGGAHSLLANGELHQLQGAQDRQGGDGGKGRRAARQQQSVPQDRRVGAFGALGKLPEERRHTLHRRSGKKGGIGHVENSELWQEVFGRDQGDACRNGLVVGYGHSRLAA